MSKLVFKLLLKSEMCFFNPSQVAFLKSGFFLGVCLFFKGFIFISARTASWSLTPGIILQAVTKLGLFVITRSRELLPLIGVVTSWVSLRSSNKSTN